MQDLNIQYLSQLERLTAVWNLGHKNKGFRSILDCLGLEGS